jgi:hypothetical protein
VNHSFNTNLCPIPYFHFDLGNGQIIDTWYVKQCQGDIELFGYDVMDLWQLDPILYGAYWSGDVNAVFQLGLVPAWFPINNIPTFTFAQKIDKILNLLIPFVMGALFLGASISLYKRKVVNARG